MKKCDVTKEFREKRKKIAKKLWQNPDFVKNQRETHLGHSKPKNAYKFPKGHKINVGKKNAFRNRMISSKCIICEKEIKFFKSQPKKTCSKKCHSELISRQMKGNQFTKGFKPTEKQLANLCRKSGKEHFNWKGGITPLLQQIRSCFKYRQWRSDVFTRDNFTCVLCGQFGGKLIADHYPKSFGEIFYRYSPKTLEEALLIEEFWNINNGRTLCKKCHYKTETYGEKGKQKLRKMFIDN